MPLDSSTNYFLLINLKVSEIANNTIIEARDVTYFENIFPFQTRIPAQVFDIPSSSKFK